MTRRKIERPFKRPKCVALPYLRNRWVNNKAGAICSLPAHGEIDGHALCWTHYTTVTLGRATVDQVLGGRR